MSYVLHSCDLVALFYCFGYILLLFFFFFNDPATTEIYTLSLHDALPISPAQDEDREQQPHAQHIQGRGDRKSTRLNSSHVRISYAVFCLKKKTQKKKRNHKNKKKQTNNKTPHTKKKK